MWPNKILKSFLDEPLNTAFILGTINLRQDCLLSTSHQWSEFFDVHDSGVVPFTANPRSHPPQVNFKNLLNGILAILTGKNSAFIVTLPCLSSSSNFEFLASGINGDSSLHPSVYLPSAPPLFEVEAINYSPYQEILKADPPEWLPDSCTTSCMQCRSPFTALTRGRHHCRFCGGIFCRTCSKGRCLMPINFQQREPQRVCDACYDRLDPLQGILINLISNSVQSAKHDVTDWTCTKGWLNLPVGLSMEHEIYKAANILRSYCKVNYFGCASCRLEY